MDLLKVFLVENFWVGILINWVLWFVFSSVLKFGSFLIFKVEEVKVLRTKSEVCSLVSWFLDLFGEFLLLSAPVPHILFMEEDNSVRILKAALLPPKFPILIQKIPKRRSTFTSNHICLQNYMTNFDSRVGKYKKNFSSFLQRVNKVDDGRKWMRRKRKSNPSTSQSLRFFLYWDGRKRENEEGNVLTWIWMKVSLWIGINLSRENMESIFWRWWDVRKWKETNLLRNGTRNSFISKNGE